MTLYYDAAEWIWKNKDQINVVLNYNKKQKIPIDDISEYYRMTAEAFKPLKSFIISIEADTILRSQMYKYARELSRTWKEQSVNELSQELRK